MNLSEPLEGIMSRVEAASLRVLSRTDGGFSGRQVHSLAGVGSTSSVHRALIGLVDIGVVNSTPQPPAIVYRINRAHALWPAIELALAARSRVFDGIGRFCTQELPAELGLTVVVYGSVARSDSTLDSDVDLLVVYPDGIDPEARADFSYQIASYVERVTGNAAHVFSLERADVATRVADGDRFIANVLTDGIVLHGPELSA